MSSLMFEVLKGGIMWLSSSGETLKIQGGVVYSEVKGKICDFGFTDVTSTVPRPDEPVWCVEMSKGGTFQILQYTLKEMAIETIKAQSFF